MLNPHYISGFVDGEGCFSTTINKPKIRHKDSLDALDMHVQPRHKKSGSRKEIGLGSDRD